MLHYETKRKKERETKKHETILSENDHELFEEIFGKRRAHTRKKKNKTIHIISSNR